MTTMQVREEPVDERRLRSWLDAPDGVFGEGEAKSPLFAASRAAPSLVEAALDAWLASKLSLSTADDVPWFHELVTRWGGHGRIAFESNGERLSYDELEARTAARARAWRADGVDAGSTVGICRPFGVDYVVDVLTAFRVGACAAWIPPYGDAYEATALRALMPDFVSTTPGSGERWREADVCVLTSESRLRGFWSSSSAIQTYTRQQESWAVLSPTAAETDGESPSWQPTRLGCEALRRAVARDAAVVWRLRPGDAVTAPGFDGPRYQPGLLLSCLIAGGCYVHSVRQEVAAQQRRSTRAWRVCGVGSELCALWSQQPEARPQADLWFRDLEAPYDAERWKDFVDASKLEALHCAVCTEPALGGVVLATPQRRNVLDGDVYVAPGVAFELTPLEGAPPDSGVGVLELPARGAGKPYVLLAETHTGRLRYLGTTEPRRGGCVFPRAEVEALVERLPGVVAARVVAVPSGRAEGGVRFGLLVFARSRASWNDVRCAAVRAVVEAFLREALPSEVRPDFVECHPVAPAFDEGGAVDRARTHAQRLRGVLKKKAKLRVFRELAALYARSS